MTDAPDSELLAQFARDASETAFAVLVDRHLPLVHSVALRHTLSPEQAQDIAQAVFIILARKAGTLGHKTVLPGWLYHTARLTAANWQRGEMRRVRREQEVFMQSNLNESGSSSQSETEAEVWRELAPQLDEAMGQLGRTDRDALVLRFFQNRSLAEVGAALGLEERAAQKRVGRALEKLRKFFLRRGLALSAGAIAGAVSANSVQAAPVGLAAAITATALSGTVATTAAIVTATKTIETITMTILQKTVITALTAALVVSLGAGVFEARQNSQLRSHSQMLQQPQTLWAEQIQKLQTERDEATNRLAAMAGEIAKHESDDLELLRLRGMAGVARQAIGESERLRAQLAKQASAASTNLLTGAMADAMKQAMEQQVEGHLARITASLQLNPEQTQAVSNILMQQAQVMSAGMQQAMSGNFNKDEIMKLGKAGGDPDTQIKALLTPDQLAAYPAYQQEEAAHNASLAANTELAQLQTTLDLKPEQLDQVYAALYGVSFNQLTGSVKPPATTDMAGTMQWTLDQKTGALEPILTPAQMNRYRQQQALQAKIIKDTMDKMKAAGF